MSVAVTVQETPNPNARRFLVDRPLQEQPRGRFFTDPASADDPLARQLLEAEGVVAVMLLPTSVTVTKAPAATWDEVERLVRERLDSYFP